MNEVGDKPWYVGQILCGPITLATSIISVQRAASDRGGIFNRRGEFARAGRALAAVAFAVVGDWALYTAVAGMLNFW